MRGGVAATVVVIPDVAHPLRVPSEQRVHERRLPDPGHADEDQGLAGAEPGRESIEAGARSAAEHDDRGARERFAEGRCHGCRVGVEVTFVDNQERPGTATVDGGQVALYATVVDEPPLVFRVAVAKRADNPDDVDVGGDDL